MNTVQIQLTKLPKEWGKSPMYRDSEGKLYTHKEVLAIRKSVVVDGVSAETLEKQAKAAKKSKNSKSKPSNGGGCNKKLGATIQGESFYGIQKAECGKATAESVSRVNLAKVTTEDEWPTVSIPMFPDDEDFCHPDSRGDWWYQF